MVVHNLLNAATALFVDCMSGVRDVDMEVICNICSHGTQKTRYVLLDVVMSANTTSLLYTLDDIDQPIL